MAIFTQDLDPLRAPQPAPATTAAPTQAASHPALTAQRTVGNTEFVKQLGARVFPGALDPDKARNDAKLVQWSQRVPGALVVYARGVQIYRNQPKQNGAGREYALVGPDAVLYNEKDEPIGHHSLGPSWQIGNSKILGTLTDKKEANAANRDAVKWLELDVAMDYVPSGVFTGVRKIRRVETIGGKPPSSVPEASPAIEEIRVPYQAVYHFLR